MISFKDCFKPENHLEIVVNGQNIILTWNVALQKEIHGTKEMNLFNVFSLVMATQDALHILLALDPGHIMFPMLEKAGVIRKENNFIQLLDLPDDQHPHNWKGQLCSWIEMELHRLQDIKLMLKGHTFSAAAKMMEMKQTRLESGKIATDFVLTFSKFEKDPDFI